MAPNNLRQIPEKERSRKGETSVLEGKNRKFQKEGKGSLSPSMRKSLGEEVHSPPGGKRSSIRKESLEQGTEGRKKTPEKAQRRGRGGKLFYEKGERARRRPGRENPHAHTNYPGSIFLSIPIFAAKERKKGKAVSRFLVFPSIRK